MHRVPDRLRRQRLRRPHPRLPTIRRADPTRVAARAFCVRALLIRGRPGGAPRRAEPPRRGRGPGRDPRRRAPPRPRRADGVRAPRRSPPEGRRLGGVRRPRRTGFRRAGADAQRRGRRRAAVRVDRHRVRGGDALPEGQEGDDPARHAPAGLRDRARHERRSGRRPRRRPGRGGCRIAGHRHADRSDPTPAAPSRARAGSRSAAAARRARVTPGGLAAEAGRLGCAAGRPGGRYDGAPPSGAPRRASSSSISAIGVTKQARDWYASTKYFRNSGPSSRV